MLETIRKRLRVYLEKHSYGEVQDEFGIDRAALHRFAHGTHTLKLSDRVLDMIVGLGVMTRPESTGQGFNPLATGATRED